VICDEPLLREISERLQSVELLTGDYRETASTARRGDLVYFDPPYPPRPGRTVQNIYGAARFRDEAHAELAEYARELDRRGCTVVLSNADRPGIRELYGGFHIESAQVRRQIHFSVEARAQGDTELIISNRALSSK
jgi:DNA adenine methylase